MAAIKDQAIVLRHLDYSETSQVLAMLTREHGPRRLIAKGVKRSTKKRFAVGIDLLERGDVVFLPRAQDASGLCTLTEWQQRQAYLGLRAELGRWYAAQYAAEIAVAMTEEGDPHPELYDALHLTLSNLEGSQAPLSEIVRFQHILIDAVGLWPELHRCVACGREAPEGRAGYYSAHQGGLICRGCEPSLPEKRMIPAATLTALRRLRTPDHVESAPLVDDADAVSDEQTNKIFDVLNYTLSHIMSRPPATAAFVVR